MARCIVLHQKDNVAVAVDQIAPGEVADLSIGGCVRVLDEIPFAHKIAISPITKGDLVFKYGEIIGEATDDIAVGQHVHVHNIRSLRVRK